jgi:hypothetical protein
MPLDCSTPRFRSDPTFNPGYTKVLAPKASATLAESSVEPLSTTIISGRLDSRFKEAKQVSSRLESFLTGTMTDTVKISD